MINILDGKLVLNFENIQYWHYVIGIAVISVIYGYITHLHSVTQIHKYNKISTDPISDPEIVLLLLTRTIIGLPWRILLLCVGILSLILLSIGKAQLRSNYVLNIAIQWHWKPHDIRLIMDELDI